MSITPVLFINEDNMVKITGLKDAETGDYVNDATGTFDVLDEDGTAVAGMTNITITYVAGSNGDYAGYLDKLLAADLTQLERYQVAITMASGAKDLYRRIPLNAIYHGAN